MNKPFAKTRKFVNDNRTMLAFAAGSIATSAVIIASTRNLTILNVTRDQMELVKQGGAVVYELKDQTLHLVNIAAVEAAQAL